MMSVLDDSLEPPDREDFRRGGKGVPLILNPDTGKFVRYKRSSSAGNILDDDYQLVDWRVRTIVEGAAQRPDLMAQVSVLDHDKDKGEIRDVAEECLVAGKGTQRSVTGTAIHRMLDHVDLGHDWTPAPQFRAAVDSYIAMLELYGLVPVDVEVRCVNDEWKYAGTCDRRYRLTRNLITPDGVIVPIGTIIMGDTKTGQSLEYASGSYTTQLAAYAGSVRYDVKTNERTEFDPPTFQDWALIIHVDALDARTDVYWVDLEAGRMGIELAQRVREWRKRTDLILPARPPLYPVADIKEPEVIATSDKLTINVRVGDGAATVDMAEVVEEIDKAIEREGSKERHPSNEPPDTPRASLAAVEEAPAPLAPVDVPDALADVVAPSTDLPEGDPERQPTTVDLAAVRTWLRQRINAIREAGEGPTGMLQRKWPTGVPGLKHDTQTADMLDAVSEVVWKVEAEYSLPFPTTDPRTPVVAPRDFSTRWSKPTGNDDPREDMGDAPAIAFRMELDKHPRRALLRGWTELAMANDNPAITDRWALTHALYEFAMLPVAEWNDDDVTQLLDGTLRAIGYEDGIYALGNVVAEHAPHIMSSAFAITAGNALLLYGEDGLPVVRTIN